MALPGSTSALLRSLGPVDWQITESEEHSGCGIFSSPLHRSGIQNIHLTAKKTYQYCDVLILIFNISIYSILTQQCMNSWHDGECWCGLNTRSLHHIIIQSWCVRTVLRLPLQSLQYQWRSKPCRRWETQRRSEGKGQGWPAWIWWRQHLDQTQKVLMKVKVTESMAASRPLSYRRTGTTGTTAGTTADTRIFWWTQTAANHSPTAKFLTTTCSVLLWESQQKHICAPKHNQFHKKS